MVQRISGEGKELRGGKGRFERWLKLFDKKNMKRSVVGKELGNIYFTSKEINSK